MHEQEPEISVFSTRKFRQAILPPATEDWDAEERRAVMYAILLVDATFSSSSHYPGCVMVDELVSAEGDRYLRIDRSTAGLSGRI
jgi:hypothetical protein